jgi:YHS domain-containing protein
MKIAWWGVAGAVAVLVSAGLFWGCGNEEGTGPAATPATPATPAVSASPEAPATATVEIAQKLCPVMGGPISEDVYVDYQGRRVYFCCPACPEKFKADPAKYLAIVDAQLKGQEPADGQQAEQ